MSFSGESDTLAGESGLWMSDSGESDTLDGSADRGCPFLENRTLWRGRVGCGCPILVNRTFELAAQHMWRSLDSWGLVVLTDYLLPEYVLGVSVCVGVCRAIESRRRFVVAARS